MWLRVKQRDCPGLSKGLIWLRKTPHGPWNVFVMRSRFPPGALEDPAVPVGVPGGRVPDAAGKTSPVGCRLWICSRLPALQPGGVSLAGLQHLSDPHLHRHAAVDSADLAPVSTSLNWFGWIKTTAGCFFKWSCWILLPPLAGLVLTGLDHFRLVQLSRDPLSEPFRLVC